ncbi:MAG: B12-binding domain-containing radical SAM protein [Candidatus Aquicultorales bacterium]
MRILLVNAAPKKKFGVVGQIFPPLGILYLISYIQKYAEEEHEFKALDGYRTGAAKILSEVEKFDPQVVGLSYTTQAATGAYDLIDEVKSMDKGIVTVSGGPHPTLNPVEPFERSKNDVVVVGEGEATFLEVVERLGNREELDARCRGIAFRDKQGRVRINEPRPLIENLDEIPFPARQYLDIEEYAGYHYKKRARDTSILSARGCPYNCVYCSNPVWKLQKPWYRKRSPRNLADEIEQVVKEYGITEFYDETDEFNANLRWAKEACDEITSRNLEIAWKVQMRADRVDEELARKMARSGCWLAFFGVETGNDATALGINKNITTDQVERSLATMKDAGIKTFALLMAFNAWETDGELRYEGVDETLATLDFVKGLVKKKKVDLMSWSLTTPYPGSKLYEIAVKHDLIPEETVGKWEMWDSSSNLVMRLPGVTEDDWLSLQRKGKILQTFLLFRSGTFNLRSLPQYFKKAFYLLRRSLAGGSDS